MADPKRGNRPGQGWLADDFSYRYPDYPQHAGTKSVTDFVREVQDAIGTGDPLNIPGQWPNSIRQLFQDTDFHIYGRKIFRRIDPLTDAHDGNVGQDIADADVQALDDFADEYADRPDIRQAVREAQAFLAEHSDELDPMIRPGDAMNFVDSSADVYAALGESREDDDSPSEDFEADEDLDDGPVIDGQSLLDLLDTQSLNSPFCGLGYRPPKDRYEWRSTEQSGMSWSDLADMRREHCADLCAEAKDLDTEEDINKFYWRIRDDYNLDKEIWKTWSEDAFQQDRSIYMDSLRRQNLDEETIRRKLWFGFDRVSGVRPAIIIDGQLVRPRTVMDDSIWKAARSQAMQELVMTKSQWNKLYEILRARRQWCRNEGSNLSAQAIIRRINAAKGSKDLKEMKTDFIARAGRLNQADRSLVWKTFSKVFNDHMRAKR